MKVSYSFTLLESQKTSHLKIFSMSSVKNFKNLWRNCMLSLVCLKQTTTTVMAFLCFCWREIFQKPSFASWAKSFPTRKKQNLSSNYFEQKLIKQAEGSQEAIKSELGTVKANFCSHMTANNSAPMTGSSHCCKQTECNYNCAFKGWIECITFSCINTYLPYQSHVWQNTWNQANHSTNCTHLFSVHNTKIFCLLQTSNSCKII